MKGFRKILLLSFVFSLLVVSLHSTGWADEYFGKDDPVAQGWSTVDLLVARPLGFVAAVAGSCVFVAGLLFTVPADIVASSNGYQAHATKDSAYMFILSPLRFSFVREFPDENI